MIRSLRAAAAAAAVSICAVCVRAAEPDLYSFRDLDQPAAALRKSPEPWRLAEHYLEAGDFAVVQSFYDGLSAKDAAVSSRTACLLALYQGDYQSARDALASLADPWSAERRAYLDGLLAAATGQVEAVSDHFRLRTDPEDAFISEGLLHALDNAHSKMAEVFQLAPSTPAIAEVYPTEARFSKASTLTPEDLERSGAIGICKFRRLMVLSPKATPLGYRWLDAAAHEYNHFLVNGLSGSLCPLWLHEGVARYYETAWRRTGPFEHTPAAETKLAEAALLDSTTAPALVPFRRMEPSMIYLKDQDEVALAFAEVSDAVAYMIERFGPEKLAELLGAFRKYDRAAAFERVLDMTEEEFEASWKESLKDRPWRVSKGAMEQKILLKPVDEVTFAGPDAQGHLRLGDRLRQQSQLEAAALEYGKALDQEPDNGVALLKFARAQLALGNGEKAEEALRHAVEKNTSYVTPYVALGQLLYDDGRYEEAAPVLQEALEINPYDPRIHQYLGLIEVDVGHFTAARKWLEQSLRLDPQNDDIRRVLRQMPRER